MALHLPDQSFLHSLLTSGFNRNPDIADTVYSSFQLHPPIKLFFNNAAYIARIATRMQEHFQCAVLEPTQV